MEINGLLIDLDGTLVETQVANLKSYNFALQEYGLKFTAKEYQATNGLDSKEFLVKSFPRLTENDIIQIRQIKASVYPNYLHETRVNEPLLSLIKNSLSNKKIGLVTTAKRKNVHEILKYHKIEEIFNVIITGDDVTCSKPNPEPYLKALKMIGLQASEVIVFEDSETGCESAIAAGLKVIRVLNGKSFD